MKIQIHEKADYEGMRKAGSLAAMVLEYISPYIKVGISTLEINRLCHNFIVDNGGIPAPLNYKGFPKSICTSLNNVVCHGIPREDQVLKDGDILNIDITVILDGWHGDTSKTFMVGNSVTGNNAKFKKVKKLVSVAKEAMDLGISIVKPGITFGDIGKVIQDYVEENHFSVVRDYCGHGIGRQFHELPQVLHYYSKFDSHVDTEVREGMFFTIEPMVNIGSEKTILSKNDGWTVFTKDGSLSAQFEHTIGVTKDGYEIFTLI